MGGDQPHFKLRAARSSEADKTVGNLDVLLDLASKAFRKRNAQAGQVHRMSRTAGASLFYLAVVARWLAIRRCEMQQLPKAAASGGVWVALALVRRSSK